MMEFTKIKLPGRAGNAAVSDATRRQALREAFSQTVERIERLVDLETATLEQYRPIDFSEFNHRKSHAILELSRSIRALGSEAYDDNSRKKLERLSGKLERNLATLDIHLKAVRQVCAVISRAIQSEESDGTYSSSIHRRYEQS